MDEELEDFLIHYGVKGMKWGTRRTRTEGVSAKVDRDARKDAQEHARAKMFYGEGAGTRRKLINAKVEQKAKNNPDYKKAFDNHLATQDMSKHASKATSERKRKDVVGKTAKTARGAHRSLTGGFGSVSLASAVVASAYVGAKRTGIDKTIASAAKKSVSEAKKAVQNQQNKKAVNDWLKNQDWGV